MGIHGYLCSSFLSFTSCMQLECFSAVVLLYHVILNYIELYSEAWVSVFVSFELLLSEKLSRI